MDHDTLLAALVEIRRRSRAQEEYDEAVARLASMTDEDDDEEEADRGPA